MQLSKYTQRSDSSLRKEFTAFGLIEDELSRVRALIINQLAHCSEPAGQLVEKLNICGGKMLRPGLVILSYYVARDAACENSSKSSMPSDTLIRIAAIVEMIHNATLLHDDVIDEGQKRRGAPTINSLYGNESAVLLGDFLLSGVFKMCANLQQQIIEIIAAATERICEGELRQLAVCRKQWELDELEYINIITEKSAILFSTCCRLGALLAGADENKSKLLSDFGLNVGIAFQIIDDLLDITGDESKIGKTLGSDINKNKPTLAVIHLLKTIDRTERNSLIEKLNTVGESKKDLARLLDQHACLKYARRCANGYIAKAKELLMGLKESDARNALMETAQFAVDRTS